MVASLSTSPASKLPEPYAVPNAVPMLMSSSCRGNRHASLAAKSSAMLLDGGFASVLEQGRPIKSERFARGAQSHAPERE